MISTEKQQQVSIVLRSEWWDILNGNGTDEEWIWLWSIQMLSVESDFFSYSVLAVRKYSYTQVWNMDVAHR